MAVERSYAPLGLFLVVTLIVVLATALFFIQRLRSREVLAAVTYTTENVSGLEVSSPVRYRGVSVGRVSDIRVDPNTSSIEIGFEVFLDRLTTIGINVEQSRANVDRGIFQKLRAQVIGNPVTGEAYLLLDRPVDPPPPVPLSFTPDRPYVASMPTVLSKVQDRLPELLERANTTLTTLREIVGRIPNSLDRTDRFFTNVERIVQESKLPELSADSRKFLGTSTAQLAQMEQITADLKKLIETQEVFAKLAEETRTAINSAELPATTQTARDTLHRTSLAADDLRRSLPAIRDSLEQMRELARFLEEQPESVVYGPRHPEVKPK
jgi:paraquat-inducible protein B